MYVQVPPMNLQANLSPQGKMKLVRIIKRIKKLRNLPCLVQQKETVLKLSDQVKEENEC